MRALTYRRLREEAHVAVFPVLREGGPFGARGLRHLGRVRSRPVRDGSVGVDGAATFLGLLAVHDFGNVLAESRRTGWNVTESLK